MSTAPFEFETLFKGYPDLASRTQEVSRIYLDATSEILREQAATAEKLVDFGVRAMRLPEKTEPTEFFADRLQQQRELLDTVSASAEKIIAQVNDASHKALSAWADVTTPEGNA